MRRVLASMRTMSDPEAILETFYLNALQLPKAAWRPQGHESGERD